MTEEAGVIVKANKRKLYPYSPELFNQICEKIESGSSIKKACEDSGLGPRTFYSWVNDNGLQERFTQAKQILAHQLMSLSLDCADNMRDFEKTAPKDKEGRIDPKVATAYVSSQRFAGDLYKALASKYLPAEYGDKIETRNVSESVVYVVSFSPQDTPKEEATIVDIPVNKNLPKPMPEKDELVEIEQLEVEAPPKKNKKELAVQRAMSAIRKKRKKAKPS